MWWWWWWNGIIITLDNPFIHDAQSTGRGVKIGNHFDRLIGVCLSTLCHGLLCCRYWRRLVHMVSMVTVYPGLSPVQTPHLWQPSSQQWWTLLFWSGRGQSGVLHWPVSQEEEPVGGADQGGRGGGCDRWWSVGRQWDSSVCWSESGCGGVPSCGPGGSQFIETQKVTRGLQTDSDRLVWS